MLTSGQLEALNTFQPAPFLVTSLYLDADPRRFPKAALVTHLKDLSRQRLSELRNAGISHEQIKSVEADVERLEKYLSGHPFPQNAAGFAAFSCVGKDFFQTWTLPHAFKATLLVSPAPYTRPLTALMAQSIHAVTFLVDHKQAHAWTLHGEDIQDAWTITSETGSKIKKGGFEGKEERHIEHHHDEAIHHHYQEAADRLLKMFQSAPFEYLVLGGHLDEIHDFERHLHSYLTERVAGRFRTDLKQVTQADLRAKTLEMVRTEEKNRQQEAVQRLIGASRTNGGLAVIGLRNTLSALNDRRVASLLVTSDFEAPGRRCPACETLFEKETRCPRCTGATAEAADVVDETIALTVHQGGTIRILPADSPLAANGKIGAMLRY